MDAASTENRVFDNAACQTSPSASPEPPTLLDFISSLEDIDAMVADSSE